MISRSPLAAVAVLLAGGFVLGLRHPAATTAAPPSKPKAEAYRETVIGNIPEDFGILKAVLGAGGAFTLVFEEANTRRISIVECKGGGQITPEVKCITRLDPDKEPKK